MKKSEKTKTQITELTEKALAVIKRYRKDFPDVKMGRDYLPFKVAEEWGECLQAYLMLTNRGRQKGKSKKEIKNMLANELADVFAYLLVFADNEGVDLVEAITQKWFSYLNN